LGKPRGSALPQLQTSSCEDNSNMTTVMSFKIILDDIYKKQKTALTGTKVRTLDFVLDDQSFDTAFDSLLKNKTNSALVKQKLNPSVEKTKAFATAIQSLSHDESYGTLLWRALYSALEVSWHTSGQNLAD